jgi:hypothetical protein
METKVTVGRWALSCSKAQNAVASDAWDDADPKTLFTACAKVLPEPIRTLLQQNKPEDGQHTWTTAAKFLNQRTMACEQDDVFQNSSGRMRLPTRRRSLMPARAKAARKASLAKAKVARRAAGKATSESVTEKVTQMRSLPRRRRRTT